MLRSEGETLRRDEFELAFGAANPPEVKGTGLSWHTHTPTHEPRSARTQFVVLSSPYRGQRCSSHLSAWGGKRKRREEEKKKLSRGRRAKKRGERSATRRRCFPCSEPPVPSSHRDEVPLTLLLLQRASVTSRCCPLSGKRTEHRRPVLPRRRRAMCLPRCESRRYKEFPCTRRRVSIEFPLRAYHRRLA